MRLRARLAAPFFRASLLSSVAETVVVPKRIQLFTALKLSRFNEDEISRAYTSLYGDNNNAGKADSADEAKITELLKANNIVFSGGKPPSSEEFKQQILKLGEQLDPRIWPLGLSFLGTGLSIGIIVPILPLLVEQLHMPPSQFGLVVSAFGLAKLVGNIPSAQWVEKYGRKVVMVNGMLLCAVGIGSIGFSVDPAFGTPSLVASRFVTGFGVSAFTSAAFMMLADISTNLNRTRTMSPVMASFQAGTALGPAIGGLAVTHMGIGPSYFAVGGMIGALAGLNHLYIRESKPNLIMAMPPAAIESPPATSADGKSAAALPPPPSLPPPQDSFTIARKAWRELMQQRDIRDVVFANTFYWIGLSGTSLTLLPLFMVDLSLTPTQIGLCFAFSSSVSVMASQPAAYLADKWGKRKMIGAGMGVLGGSMLCLPYSNGFESLLVLLAPIALGSTVLSAVPTALMGDLVSPSRRSQALALLRTAGDVGLLVGATCSGLSATLLTLGPTMQINGLAMLGVATVWALRQTKPVTFKDKEL